MLVPYREGPLWANGGGFVCVEIWGMTQEIHLNSQMVMDGMAYHYEKYSGSCPQPEVLEKAEKIAKEQSVGVWVNPGGERPWKYRKREATGN